MRTSRGLSPLTPLSPEATTEAWKGHPFPVGSPTLRGSGSVWTRITLRIGAPADVDTEKDKVQLPDLPCTSRDFHIAHSRQAADFSPLRIFLIAFIIMPEFYLSRNSLLYILLQVLISCVEDLTLQLY